MTTCIYVWAVIPDISNRTSSKAGQSWK